jgi:two-component system response regulator GlrR
MNVSAASIILHLDDNQSVSDSMAILLRSDGYQVSSAHSGSEALQAVMDGLHPDVLMMDFNLGRGGNGASITQELQHLLHYTPPVIMLTGNPISAKYARLPDTLVWLTGKPLNPLLLLASLPSLVQLSRATRPLFLQSK